MTTKQIAESVGKTERCVQQWAKKASDKISSIGEKISSVQKSGKPADYSLEETITIIETGMGRNAAALFRENATRNAAARDSASANLVPDTIALIVRETVSSMIPAIVAAVRGALPAQAIAEIPALRISHFATLCV